jgi:hypothetical protein
MAVGSAATHPEFGEISLPFFRHGWRRAGTTDGQPLERTETRRPKDAVKNLKFHAE